MGLLIFAYRKQYIINRKADINMKLLTLRQKLMDLQSYASSIADGTVSMNDLMNAPASMFNRMSVFMMYSHQASMMGAQEKFGPMSQLAMSQMAQSGQNDPMQMQMYQQSLFSNLYKQEREQFNKVEERILHQQETQIQKQVTELETQAKMLESEEKGCDDAIDKEAGKTVKYA